MVRKIFLNSFIVAVSVLLITIASITGILFNRFTNQAENDLKIQASYISCGLDQMGYSFIDSLKKVSTDKNRVTLIAKDGKVIADTVADVKTMDNHINRKEIQEAKKNGKGMSIRYSKTLTEKTVYYAMKLKNEDILRLSTTQSSVFSILIGLIYPLCLLIIIGFVLIFLFSKHLAKSIVKPINNINLDNPKETVTYDELTPLLKKIITQKETIKNQLKDARQKQEEFNLITENMSEGFLLIDNQTNLLTYNSAALKLLQIDKVVENASVLTLNRTKDFRNLVEEVLLGVSAQRDLVVNEHNYKLIANPVYEENKIIGAVIVIIDITQTVKAEQLRREFTSNVSHELKTPLTSISGFAELMKYGGVDQETVKDFSKSIYDETQRLISLVDDILKVSRLDDKEIKFEKEKVNLYEIAKTVIERLKIQGENKKLNINLIGEDVFIYGVRKIIDEIIFNLCDNAIKYNKEGGYVNVKITKTQSKGILEVEDSGIGIPQIEKSRVFERFYRVDKSHSKQIGGTGLGLSIVKHGCIYHNANIKMESQEGVGTKITIEFPLK